MENFINWVRDLSGGAFDGVSEPVIIAMSIVAGLLIIASIFALGISIYLAVKYVVYNKKKNSCGKTGEQVARSILDGNGLGNIKVSSTGSILFGNSYSHYFKKVRLRRLTWKKDSVTSLAMAAQKSALAVLDKGGDKDMKTRVRLTPVIYFGPVMFIPLVVIGALLDILVFTSGNGLCTFILTCVATVIYLLSFVMSILVLKTEKKAQKRAYEIMKAQGLATEEELADCKKLFRLYNIEYINDMVIALLELIYRVLQIVAYAQNSSSSSK
ncbi:MAG: zinc metallopeptidase [Candidatus Coproplasma sp.]